MSCDLSPIEGRRLTTALRRAMTMPTRSSSATEYVGRTYRESLQDQEEPARKRKLAEQTAQQIERDIVRRGWPVGEVIGSEKDLLRKYGVSRAILREAVRLLEHHYVAKMRRGPGGGLVVMEPNTAAIAEAVALYLEYRQVEPSLLFEARSALELTCVQLAAERIDEAGIALLRELLTHEDTVDPEAMPVHSHQWHVAVAELAGNPAMSMFVTILTRLAREAAAVTREHADPPPEMDREANEVHNAHVRISEAIIAGDASLARHRMRRHLEAIAEYIR